MFTFIAYNIQLINIYIVVWILFARLLDYTGWKYMVANEMVRIERKLQPLHEQTLVIQQMEKLCVLRM